MTATTQATRPAPTAATREITGPAGPPLVGNTLQLQRDPLGFIMRVAAEYGDVARYRLGNVTFNQVSHPDGAQRILQDNHHNYIKGDMFDILRQLAGDGLFTSEGELWLRQRRLMQPAFHRRRIAGFGEVMTGRTLDMLARWDQRADPGQPLDIAEEMAALTMAIISETMFGARLDADTHAVSQAITLLLADINFRFQLPFYPSLRWPTLRNRRTLAAMRTVDDVVLGIIEQRRRSGEQRDDLLGMLMETGDEETGQGMSDKQLRDEVVTIFVAGHETTALVLTWAFYLLSQHPDQEATSARRVGAGAGRACARRGRRAQPALHPHGHRRDVAALPARLDHQPRGDRRGCGVRVSHPGRRGGGGQPVRDPSLAGLVARAGALRPAAFRSRHAARAAPFRLHALRRRSAPVHRQQLRTDGGDADPGHGGATLPAAAGAGRGRQAATGDDPASSRWAADGGGDARITGRIW